ncbi:expressed unknown protein [Seminavis robusta]|uniref:Uncharacterized protein n=1 Tax=Seminavis robusta TaxID=568900 RepID=A0A9N8EJV5_9STRA|nr:expressed unknown protein [Seminavis robusta]|eukprot:Sro1049_g235410.1 n/a (504) ;mRNA; r:21167-22769
MKATPTRTILFICALLVLVVPSAAASRVKGLKGVSQSASSVQTRGLKKEKEEKAKKTKKAQGPSTRSCRSTTKPNEVTFECRSDTGDKKKAKGSEDPEQETRGIFLTPDEEIKDKIKYRVKTDKESIRVKIEYEKEVETIDTSTETETEFELTFDRVIEYVKSTREQVSGGAELSEAYDWDADEIVQTIPLRRWDDIPGITTASDDVFFFTASTTLPPQTGAMQPGTIQFNYTISQADLGEQITANSMKIDVRILNFPWTRDDSYVALMSTVESKKRVELEYDNDATVGKGKTKETEDVVISFSDELSDMGVSAFGAYTWAHEAEVTSDATVASARQGGRRDTEEEQEEVDGPEVVEDSSAKPGADPAGGPAGGPEPAGGPGPEPPAGPADGPEPPAGPADTPPGIADAVANGNGPAEVDVTTEGSTTIEVIATSPEATGTENKQSIAYSFVGDAAHSAKEIFWDPQAGVSYEEPVAESAAGRPMSTIGFVGSLAVALVYLAW